MAYMGMIYMVMTYIVMAQHKRDTVELSVLPATLQPTHRPPRLVHEARPLVTQRHEDMVGAAVSVPEWEPAVASHHRGYN